jgi:hypothetical protein
VCFVLLGAIVVGPSSRRVAHRGAPIVATRGVIVSKGCDVDRETGREGDVVFTLAHPRGRAALTHR